MKPTSFSNTDSCEAIVNGALPFCDNLPPTKLTVVLWMEYHFIVSMSIKSALLQTLWLCSTGDIIPTANF